ncbi:MAG: DNA gyrase C-terminal beta-propeller domain-containing protein, partial [Emcibacteraceae bacterium]|nr:DNA gyrase C-terminal beta-propeller domain-containing protein [Emcibacteraceae bacterium]
ETSDRNGDVSAAFPIDEKDQLMMVTDQGRLIRVPVHDVRVAGRNTQGVTLFKVGEDEHIVSVDRIQETEDDEGEEAVEGEEGVDAENAEASSDDIPEAAASEETTPEE